MNHFFNTVFPLLHQFFPQAASYLTVVGLTAFVYSGVELFKYIYNKYLLAANQQPSDFSNILTYGMCILFSVLGVALAVLLGDRRYDTQTLVVAVIVIHSAATAVYATQKYVVKPTAKAIANLSAKPSGK